MIKIVKGYYGTNLSGPGTKLSLSEGEEERLVKIGIAVKCDNDKKMASGKVGQKVAPVQQFNDEDNSDDEYMEEVFKTEEEIRKMKKEELVSYAEEIGIENFDEKMKNDMMIDTILNYIEENSEEVDVD